MIPDSIFIDDIEKTMVRRPSWCMMCGKTPTQYSCECETKPICLNCGEESIPEWSRTICECGGTFIQQWFVTELKKPTATPW